MEKAMASLQGPKAEGGAMAERTIEAGRSIALLAEQRMRNWVLELEALQRIRSELPAEEVPRRLPPFIAISREAGAGGAEIAQRAGELLGWPVFDRQLLDHMAEQYHLPRDMLEYVDENKTHWLFECFGKWLSRRVVTQSEYISHLGHVVLMAARHTNTVFVGRGARFLLPGDRGVSVHVVAPKKMRVERTMQLQGWPEAQAVRHVDQADAGRKKFVKEYFNRDVGDPLLYDLVINRRHIGIASAAQLIVEQYRARFER
jgi:hypothetical protein